MEQKKPLFQQPGNPQPDKKQTKKKPFFNLSSNEWLNDNVTHFMKSGNMFRAKENDRLSEISMHINKNENGVKVEYDISYGSPPGTITGYKFTDLLTQMVFLAPCNTEIATKNIIEQIRKGPTEDGHRIVQALIDNLQDKYMLDEDYNGDYSSIEEIVLLPGTNLITKDAVDFDKVDKIYQNGGWVKLHPITAKVWQTMLENKYGDRIVPSTTSLYPILKKAKKVHFTMSSETGIAATLLGKGIGLIDSKESKVGKTFEAIYASLDKCGVKDRLINKFAAMVSYPESGLITIHHRDKPQAIRLFFDNMKKYKHITKKQPTQE